MTPNKTTVAHCLKEPFDVHIGRRSPKHSESVWHNPWRIGSDGTREQVILTSSSPSALASRRIRGKDEGP